MGKEQQSQLDAILRQGGLDTASVRAAFNALMAQVPVPADVHQKPVEIGGVYVIGSTATSVPLVGDLVRRTGVNATRL
jgi:epsilon-lactone hydrolase